MPSRILRETFLESNRVNALTAEQERLLTRLILAVDDFGRMSAKPATVRSKCFPTRDDITTAQVAEWLSGLQGAGSLDLYESGSDLFIRLHGVGIPRAQSSKHPEFTSALTMLDGQQILGWKASANKCLQVLEEKSVPTQTQTTENKSTVFVVVSEVVVDPLCDTAKEPSSGAPTLPLELGPPAKTKAQLREEEITAVLKRWQELFGKQRSAIEGKQAKDKRDAVKRRLEEGWTVERLMRVLAGALKCPWIMGTDPQSTKDYKGIDSILRKQTRMEEYEAAASPVASKIDANGPSEPVDVLAHLKHPEPSPEEKQRVLETLQRPSFMRPNVAVGDGS